VSSTDNAQILDRGYRKYEGARSGVIGAVRSLSWHTTRGILGLGRPGRHKVFPIIVLVIAFVPAIAFMALAALIGDLLEGDLRPEYWEMFGLSATAAMLFAALVAPEAIVRDRRNGMLSLYLSTPLTRPSYLIAKVLAVMTSMLIVVLGPVLLFLFAYTFQSQGPDGLGDWFSVLGRLLLSGLFMAGMYTAVSLGASSATDRRAFASVAVILILFGSFITVNLLTEVAEFNRQLGLLDPLSLPLEASSRIFGGETFEYLGVAGWKIFGACFGWIAAGAGAVVLRYRKLAAV
jgi:ABC-2 type transport system permease protein